MIGDSHRSRSSPVENGDFKWRIDILRETRAAVRFLSVEPLVGDVGELNEATFRLS